MALGREPIGARHSEPAIFVLGSGNIGLPLIINISLGLAIGKHIYARASRANAAAVGVWSEALRDASEGDELLGKRLELIEFAHDDRRYKRKLAKLPIQQA